MVSHLNISTCRMALFYIPIDIHYSMISTRQVTKKKRIMAKIQTLIHVQRKTENYCTELNSPQEFQKIYSFIHSTYGNLLVGI